MRSTCGLRPIPATWRARCASVVVLCGIVLGARVATAEEPFLVSTGGPGGGHVQDLERTSNGTLFALVESADRLYRSTDDGWSWSAMPEPPTNLVRLDADRANRLFAFTTDYTGPTQVQVTSDGGETWQLLPDAPSNTTALAFDAAGHGFALTAAGLYRSENGTTMWTLTTLPEHSVTAFDVEPDGTLYAGIDAQVHRSTDGGITWSQVAQLPHEVSAIASRPQGGIYVAIRRSFFAPPPEAGIYKVETAQPPVLVGLPDHRIGSFVVRSNGWVYAASEGQCNRFVCGGGGVYRSLDGGGAWLSSGIEAVEVTALVRGRGDALFAATRGPNTDIGRFPGRGIVRTSGPWTEWQAVNGGLGGTAIYSIATASNAVVYAAADHGVYSTRDHGLGWTACATPPRFFYGEDAVSWRLAVHPKGAIFAVPNRGPVSRSSDAGRSWRNLPLDPAVYYGFPAIAVSARGTLLIADDSGGVYRSADEGETWQHIVTELPEMPLMSLAAGPQALLCATTYQELYTSNDDGLTWSVAAARGGWAAISPDEQSIFLTGPPVSRFDKGPGGWTEVPLPALAEGGLSLVVGGDESVYVLAWNGLRRLRPGEASWTQLADVCPNRMLNEMPSIRLSDDGFLYTSTGCGGVSRSRAPLRDPTDVITGLPSLHCRVAPNPFRGETVFSFDLSRRGPVALTFYDVRGRLVETLHKSAPSTSGRHDIVWHPRTQLPSGIYFYRLTGPNLSSTGSLYYLE